MIELSKRGYTKDYDIGITSTSIYLVKNYAFQDRLSLFRLAGRVDGLDGYGVPLSRVQGPKNLIDITENTLYTTKDGLENTVPIPRASTSPTLSYRKTNGPKEEKWYRQEEPQSWIASEEGRNGSGSTYLLYTTALHIFSGYC